MESLVNLEQFVFVWNSNDRDSSKQGVFAKLYNICTDCSNLLGDDDDDSDDDIDISKKIII